MRRKIMSTELALMRERKMNYRRRSLSFQRFIRTSPWKLGIILTVCFIIQHKDYCVRQRRPLTFEETSVKVNISKYRLKKIMFIT